MEASVGASASVQVWERHPVSHTATPRIFHHSRISSNFIVPAHSCLYDDATRIRDRIRQFYVMFAPPRVEKDSHNVSFLGKKCHLFSVHPPVPLSSPLSVTTNASFAVFSALSSCLDSSCVSPMSLLRSRLGSHKFSRLGKEKLPRLQYKS